MLGHTNVQKIKCYMYLLDFHVILMSNVQKIIDIWSEFLSVTDHLRKYLGCVIISPILLPVGINFPSLKHALVLSL